MSKENIPTPNDNKETKTAAFPVEPVAIKENEVSIVSGDTSPKRMQSTPVNNNKIGSVASVENSCQTHVNLRF